MTFNTLHTLLKVSNIYCAVRCKKFSRLAIAPCALPIRLRASCRARSADRSGLLLPPPRGRWRPHARRRRHDLRRPRRPPTTTSLDAIEARLHLVPRYRQRLAFVPLGQGRPRWVDDPHFNAGYHIRHTALPAPGRRRRAQAAGRARLRPAAGPLQAAVGDLARRGPDDDRFAILSKTHHALVDGVSGVDIVSVLFDAARDPAPPAPPVAVAPAPRADRDRAAGRGAAGAHDGPGRGGARRARADPRAAPGRRARRARRRRAGVDGRRGPQPRAALAAQRPDRPAPALHVGRRRPRAASRPSSRRWAGRSTTSC